jgi:hypothetical protein
MEAPTPSEASTDGRVYLADLQPAILDTSGELGIGVYPLVQPPLRQGEPIQIGIQVYPKGLFTVGPSFLGYELNGEYTAFHSTFFIHPSATCSLDAQFRVYTDGHLAFFSEPVRDGGGGSLDLDVSGVRSLFLVVHDLHNSECEWAIWGDPYLVDRPEEGIALLEPLSSEPFFQVAPDAPCTDPADQSVYVFLDCSDIRRIRGELQNGSIQALLDFYDIKQYLESMSFELPEDYSPTLETFEGYIFIGHDYPPRMLALLWLITGEISYAERTAWLLENATRLPVSSVWSDSSYGLIQPIEKGGEVYQSLLFAFVALRDSNRLTEEQNAFYQDFFIRHASVMLRWSGWTDGVYNPGIRADATAAIIARTFRQDPRSEYIYMTARRSLEERMQAWFDEDGGYLEYSDNYTPYVLQSILMFAETEYRLGNDIYPTDYGGKDIHEMCRWFLYELTPLGTLVAMNDGGWTRIDPGLLTLCGMRTGDAELLFAAQRLRAADPPEHINAFFYRLATADSTLVARTPSFTSVLLPVGGMAILRSGWEPTDQYLLLQFTPSIHHQHYHTGEIILYDQVPWIIDNGYPAATDEENERALSSMDHSTVTLDDSNHANTGGEVTTFSELGNTGFIRASLQTYPHLDWVRSVLWIEPLHQWVVYDQVQASGSHLLAQRWYVQGQPERRASLWWQFTQAENALDVRIFPSIEMQSEQISRNYFLGDNLAYGSSDGFMASAFVDQWPVQITTVLTTWQPLDLESLNVAGGGQVVRASFEAGVESVAYLSNSADAYLSVEPGTGFAGQTACSLWQNDRRTGYCLYQGTSLEEAGTLLVGAVVPVSVDMNILDRIVTLEAPAGETVRLYWPDPVRSVQDGNGGEVEFLWQDSILQLTGSGQVQLLSIDSP